MSNFTCQGDIAHGRINSRPVFTSKVPTSPSHGFVGLATSNFGLADFDNLDIDHVRPPL